MSKQCLPEIKKIYFTDFGNYVRIRSLRIETLNCWEMMQNPCYMWVVSKHSTYKAKIILPKPGHTDQKTFNALSKDHCTRCFWWFYVYAWCFPHCFEIWDVKVLCLVGRSSPITGQPTTSDGASRKKRKKRFWRNASLQTWPLASARDRRRRFLTFLNISTRIDGLPREGMLNWQEELERLKRYDCSFGL